jgi:hypothetical protein
MQSSFELYVMGSLEKIFPPTLKNTLASENTLFGEEKKFEGNKRECIIRLLLFFT